MPITQTRAVNCANMQSTTAGRECTVLDGKAERLIDTKVGLWSKDRNKAIAMANWPIRERDDDDDARLGRTKLARQYNLN